MFTRVIRSVNLFLRTFCLVACVAVPPAPPTAGQEATKQPAEGAKRETCLRYEEGSEVHEPEELLSEEGVLRVELFLRRYRKPDGRLVYCYMTRDGVQSPNLRLHPGDTLLLTLRNEVEIGGATKSGQHSGKMESKVEMGSEKASTENGCRGSAATPGATNIHFHGLDVAPVCHQDDTLHTFVEPGSPPFQYEVKIPKDQPPGMYWYHPHVHGQGREQILGGASGVLIVEGIEQANSQLGGLPERVFVIRDEDLKNPNAEPSKTGAGEPPVRRDREGDILNAGTGTGKPAKDLSINFVSVPYPEYPPAVIRMKPEERQLWRVLNASTITYLGLEVWALGDRQAMGVVGLDGAAWDLRGRFANAVFLEKYILLPPAGRVEFVMTGPREGQTAQLLTTSMDTGPLGENDPWRPLATIVGTTDAAEPPLKLPTNPKQPLASSFEWLDRVSPIRERKLYFSEEPANPEDPAGATKFYITVDGEKPTVFDPSSRVPNIIVKQGTVEDPIARSPHLSHPSAQLFVAGVGRAGGGGAGVA
jgi:FtsP/CotA-like multicopper oxidase with cupredoxin domain